MLNKTLDAESEKTKIIAFENDGKKIISHLLSLQVELPNKSDQLSNFIYELDKEKHINFLESCYEALLKKADVFRVAHLMKSSFQLIEEIQIKLLVDILEIFTEKMKGDMTSGLFHEAIQVTAKTNFEFANNIELEIKQRTNIDLYGYLLVVYRGVSEANFALAYTKILALINDHNLGIKSYGLRGLGDLGVEIHSYKKEVVEILKNYNKHENRQVLSNSSYATFRHLHNFEELIEEVKLLSISDLGGVQFELAVYLMREEKNLNDWQQELLLNLFGRVRSEKKEVTNILDITLYSLVKKSKDFEFAKKVLNKWVSSRETREILKYKLDNTFPMTFPVFFTNNDFVSLLLAEWFNQDESKFHKATSAFVDYMKLHKIPPVYLQSDYIASLDFESSLYVIRKILGYTYDFDYTATFIYSFFSVQDTDSKLYHLISSVLIEHLGYNYPHKTISYLELKRQGESNDLALKSIELVLAELSARISQLRKLPRISELQPENDIVLKIEKKRQKSFSKAMESAREGSFFNFVTKITIKEGKSWFSYMHGKYSDVSTMTSFSDSIELPRADVLDVVGASMERQGFRMAKRGSE
ncbi:MAG: hypothetical protein WC635_12450 [Bacteriovorax sp.]|jgi:hypothetical protein